MSDQRKAFVETVLSDPLTSISAHCQHFGISRTTGYAWLSRYDADNPASLLDQSRAARSRPNATPPDREEAILALRRRHPSWGPRKIRACLLAQTPQTPWPACSTIGAILLANGLIPPRKRGRRPATRPCNPLPDGPCNTAWTIDFKGPFQTRDGHWCYPLTLLDRASRYLLRLQAFPSVDAAPVKHLLEAAFQEYGLPACIRADNGPPFGSRAVGRLSSLSVWWIRLGILPCPSRPARPQDNGSHERFHRTLKEDLLTPAMGTRRRQQQAFDAYQRVYNNERPHQALALQTPASVYTPSTRPYPKTLPEMLYPDEAIPRYVAPNGCLRFTGKELFLSETLAKQTVGFFPIHNDRFVVCFGPVPLAVFDERSKDWLAKRCADPLIHAFQKKQQTTRCPDDPEATA